MSYFPMMFDLKNKKILIVGAGYIAYEKLEKLLDFTLDICILADNISIKMKVKAEENNIKIINKKYEKNDYLSYDIIIVAVNDIDLQKSIYLETRSSRILCNCVDKADYCDFIFPSYVKKDDLIVSISTSGSSPAFAKEFKKYINNLIPKDISSFLNEMKALRKTIPKGKKRMEYFENKVKEYIKTWN
ncbi:MAG: bifunctional precorrin-2 dehydrogenase/sirohydrochlorin ferrochelatase [Campylobacteraceae bacterium]|nr:bifunctional precorrin-2 dehydrogenase/sirohydrochlorin ferrochelatase [Campylobacteraceae bacterium]